MGVVAQPVHVRAVARRRERQGAPFVVRGDDRTMRYEQLRGRS